MKNLSLLSLVILFLGLAGCESTWESNIEYSSTVEFILNNRSDENEGDNEPVHMWITGETIDPTNKVQPGERRKIVYTLKNTVDREDEETELEDVTVYAGRNGVVLTSFDTRVNNISILARFNWDGSNITQY